MISIEVKASIIMVIMLNSEQWNDPWRLWVIKILILLCFLGSKSSTLYDRQT